MRRPARHRPERLSALIQQTLAGAVSSELKDPRIGFVTITGVVVSADGTHATVRVSVMGTEEEKQTSIDALRHARGFLRSHLAQTLHLRTTPELHLELDRGLDHASRIDSILHDLRGESDH